MLTSKQIEEILDERGPNVEVRLRNGGFQTRVKDGDWIHHGKVHDKKEACATIDAWFAANNPKVTRNNVKIAIVGDLNDLGDLGDLTPETVLEMVKSAIQQNDEQEAKFREVEATTYAAIKKAAKMILADPDFDKLDPELTTPEEAEALRVGSMETGIPKKLLQVTCHVYDQEPGACNCGHCLSHRIFPNAKEMKFDPAGLLQMAAIKHILCERGPQPGDCKLSERDEREEQANEANSKTTKTTIRLNPLTVMKKVEGDQ